MVVVPVAVVVAGLIVLWFVFGGIFPFPGGIGKSNPPPPGGVDLSVNIDGAGFENVTEPDYPTCAPSSESGCFTLQTSGACTFTVNSASRGSGAPEEAIIVTVTDKGSEVSGVTVTLQSAAISISVSPSLTVTTGTTSGLGTGDAAFSTVTGTVPQNDAAGGTISVVATYTSGGVTWTGTETIPVVPPSTVAC